MVKGKYNSWFRGWTEKSNFYDDEYKYFIGNLKFRRKSSSGSSSISRRTKRSKEMRKGSLRFCRCWWWIACDRRGTVSGRWSFVSVTILNVLPLFAHFGRHVGLGLLKLVTHRGQFLHHLGHFAKDFLLQVVFGLVKFILHVRQLLQGLVECGLDFLDVLDLGRHSAVKEQLLGLDDPGVVFQRRRSNTGRADDDASCNQRNLLKNEAIK